MVEFNKVSKVYDKKIFAIEDVDFKINEGEFVFLIGPSGSGKTTIIKMLIRDEVPSTGRIIFNNSDITKISRDKVYKIRREIGVIFQDYKLVQDKTAYENVAFAMEAAGKKDKEIKETVPYVLDIVGLGSRLKAFPRQLSGGEQQRVAIARAIANNPKILIADEPTGNLDPASAWDIIQVLTKINNWGTTVIMSTHGTDIVNALNKRVIQMQDGRIVRDHQEGIYESAEFDLGKVKFDSKSKDSKSSSKKSSYKIKIDQIKDEQESVVEEEQSSDETSSPKNKRSLNPFKRFKKNKTPKETVEEKKDLLEMDLLSSKRSKIEKIEKELEQPKEKKLFINLKSMGKMAAKIEDSTSDQDSLEIEVDAASEKAKKIIDSNKRTPINKLNLSKEVLKDLKSLGYKYVEEIIEEGPDALMDNLMIDEEEVIEISREVKKFIEGDNNKDLK